MKLRPAIGFWALVFYGVGDILGAGIYGLVGKVAGLMGGAAWMSFGVAFFVASLTGLSYAELSSRIHRSAGEAAYCLEAFNRPALSKLIGFLVLLSGTVSMAAASHAFAGYFRVFLPSISVTACLLIFFAVLTLVNLKGIRESSAVNILCTIVEVAGLFIVIIAGWRFLGRADYLTIEVPSGAHPTTAILQGGILAFYAFIGFEDMVNVSEETQDAKRLMPRAILVALAVTSVIYILVALVAVSVVPPEELAASEAPLALVVERGLPVFPIGAFSIIAIFAVTNTALLNFVMGSRVLYGMASQELLPGVFSRVHSRFQTPHVAIAVIGVAALVLSLSGSFMMLAQATSLILLSVFFVMNISLLFLKRKVPRPEGVFHVPDWIPVLGAAASCGLFFFAKPGAYATLCVVLLVSGALALCRKPTKS